MKYFSIYLTMLLAMAFFCVPVAFAWDITKTCGTGEGEELCQEGESPLPTYWQMPCLSYYLNENGSSRMGFVSVQEALKKSIQEWNRPDISSLTLHYAGLTNEDRIGYNPYIDDNANIIVFRDDEWHESHAMIALTTVTHSRSTGIIYDADIEINSYDYPFGIYEKDGKSVVDLQNTLTHEIGHTFGLAHSGENGSTMAPYSGTGEIELRTLGQDDLDAIANIYPPSAQKCQFSKDNYFERPIYEMTEGPAAHSSSCSGVPVQGQDTSRGWLLLCGVVLCILKKRRVLRSQ
ncbi:MAG: matrixin family metalloprotease [Proteobacteria bacterium]|nr:matrixin family metalloprotease [Pseudomonadota bacterium]